MGILLGMVTKDRILNTLNTLQIPFRWLDHPPVHRVADSAKIIPDKNPVKSLFLQEKTGDLNRYLIIMDGNERLNLNALSGMLGSKKLRFAKDDVLLESMGVTPGSVSIFGLLHNRSHDITVVIDSQLLKAKELGFHPNDNTASLFIPGSAIETFLKHTGQVFKVFTLY